MTNKEYLEHIGILGMHWGKKKGKKKTTTKVIRTSSSDDHLSKEHLKTKPLKEMSNKEIRTFTERIQLERQHSELTKKEVSKGRKFVNEFLLNPLKETASKHIKELIAKLIADTILKISSRR